MKRDINSNGYIFLYSTILVVIVAVLLTTAALWLQPYQQRNKENEKCVMILSAAGVGEDGKIEFVDGELPVYLVNGNITVLPMKGNGLWGPIWGYLAIAPDGQTVIGVTFDHKSETPGLGGEITTEKFQSQFAGKQIMENGCVKPVEFDAISGATRTSNGVKEMIDKTIQQYQPYFAKR
ncbi:MAG: FMN-binding protein [Bacteroidales bacterium]|nr:FMN-binding protein [Bacteroidales bacterium]